MVGVYRLWVGPVRVSRVSADGIDDAVYNPRSSAAVLDALVAAIPMGLHIADNAKYIITLDQQVMGAGVLRRRIASTVPVRPVTYTESVAEAREMWAELGRFPKG